MTYFPLKHDYHEIAQEFDDEILQAATKIFSNANRMQTGFSSWGGFDLCLIDHGGHGNILYSAMGLMTAVGVIAASKSQDGQLAQQVLARSPDLIIVALRCSKTGQMAILAYMHKDLAARWGSEAAEYRLKHHLSQHSADTKMDSDAWQYTAHDLPLHALILLQRRLGINAASQ